MPLRSLQGKDIYRLWSFRSLYLGPVLSSEEFVIGEEPVIPFSYLVTHGVAKAGPYVANQWECGLDAELSELLVRFALSCLSSADQV